MLITKANAPGFVSTVGRSHSFVQQRNGLLKNVRNYFGNRLTSRCEAARIEKRMATETLKCGCGQEFEASEWTLSQQCEDCEHPPTPEIAPAGPNFFRSYLEYMDMRNQPIYWSQPGSILTTTGNVMRAGDTIAVQMPARFTIYNEPILDADMLNTIEEINGR